MAVSSSMPIFSAAAKRRERNSRHFSTRIGAHLWNVIKEAYHDINLQQRRSRRLHPRLMLNPCSCSSLNMRNSHFSINTAFVSKPKAVEVGIFIPPELSTFRPPVTVAIHPSNSRAPLKYCLIAFGLNSLPVE
jgi:hypothetical protein